MRIASLTILVATLMPVTPAAVAASLTEGVDVVDLSNDRLQPTAFLLDYSPSANGFGFNVLSGNYGRTSGVVDLDYVRVTVPEGFVLSELRVGNQTTVAGGSAFIAMAAGGTMPVATTATDASGLLGWYHLRTADRGTDILDDMSVPALGSSGFDRPLGAGDYTFWLQELGTGSYTYRLNFIVTPVPLPGALWLFGSAALALPAAMRRSRVPATRGRHPRHRDGEQP